MVAAANMVEIAALVGDTARATMLAALMSGQALTSSELAGLAHVSRATASEHLGKLTRARLLAVTQKRRNRYYRIASPLVARMLESIKSVAALETPARYQLRSAQDDALRFARTCYDHLAGQLGVAIADALARKKCVVLSDEGGELTAAGNGSSPASVVRFCQHPAAVAFSAVLAWTGASGDFTSPAMSAPRSVVVVSNAAGLSVNAGRALFGSLLLAGAVSAKFSAWKWQIA
ncbi:MAG: helix-turn-helix transcriptional regulator, partial [Pseudolabrys sp.]